MSMPVGVTEDSPPDLLAGGMDLRVVLPCGSVARCHVDRSTPMMDLLVQLARAHKMSPTAHTLQPFGIGNTPLPFQPSTPVGALDVFTVKIVPKTRSIGPMVKRAAPRPALQQPPFQQTFRLQVHLPRNQLFVMRASRATVLGDIQQQVCSEKNLDPNKYELRHPANLELRLSPESTLGECALTEVALVSVNSSLAPAQGQYGFLVSHSMAAEGSVSSVSSGSLGGRSTSPAPSDGDRSTSPLQVPAAAPAPAPGPGPPAAPAPAQPPSRPGRKRRPAPKPPAPPPAPTELNNNISKDIEGPGGTVISHSRNSSDSSGYHEASVLSESPEGVMGNPDSLPGVTRRNMSRSMTNLNMPQLSVRGDRHSIAISGLGRATHSVSTSSLSSAGQRKRKAPPPPAPSLAPASNGTDAFLKTQSLERHVPIAEALESPVKSSTLPACSSPPEAFPVGSSSCSPTPTPSEQSAHLSENIFPVVAPRPVPRSVRSAPVASVPAPRPRPRKQLAPTPPLSPLGVERAMSDHFVPVESSCGDMDTLSESSSALFEDQVGSEETFSSQYSGAEIEIIKDMDIKIEHKKNRTVETTVGEQESNILVHGNPTLRSSGVRPQSLPCALARTGEEVDSDFGIEEVSSQDKLEHHSPPCLNEKKILDSMSKDSMLQSNEVIPQSRLEEEWEYQLPSPPSAFQDSCCHSPTIAENSSIKRDSVPLEVLKSEQSIKQVKEISFEDMEHKNELLNSQSQTKTVASPKEEKVCCNINQNKIEDTPVPNIIQNDRKIMRESVHESAADPSQSQNSEVSNNKTVITTAKSVIRSTSVPNEAEKKRLDGTAAVLNELNLVLNEQRSLHSSSSRSALQHSESVPSSSSNHLQNFSMSVYAQPATSGETPLEVRPSLVLARRSSFSNSNGNTNSLPRVNGSGVRRTTSHATLVGNRRDLCDGSSDVLQSHTKSIENVSNKSSRRNYVQMTSSEERKSLGRAVSEINLNNAGLSVTSQLEPELLQEFMEWRRQRQKELKDKEGGEKNKSPEAAITTDLQSPQVLRTILPQLHPVQGDSSNPQESEREGKAEPHGTEVSTKTGDEVIMENPKNLLPCSEVSEPIKRQIPRGPPSIQLSTWHERPKRQVSLKMDRDYRTGMGAAVSRAILPGRDKVDGQITSVPESAVEKSDKQYKEDSLCSRPSETVVRLTRQVIAHTTPSGFRRTESAPMFNNTVQQPMGKLPEISETTDKLSSANTAHVKSDAAQQPEVLQKIGSIVSSETERSAVEIPVKSISDPSRVPIVRAVELKKPFSQQPKGVNNSVVYFSGPAVASSFSGKQSTNPPLPVKKFTSVVDISGPSNEKTVNGSSENPLSHKEPNIHVNGFNSNPEPKKTLPMPVVKGFKIAQGSVGRQLSAPAATPPPPAPPPVPALGLPVLRKVTRQASLPPLVQDPRAQLLDAIRNFGGRTNLRPTS